MSKLLIIRGIPGTGKSTLAKEYGEKGYYHVEADMYFIDKEGNYKYDIALIDTAHHWCQQQCSAQLALGNDVVVSNTFCQLWEMEPYFDMAHTFGAKIDVISLTKEYGSVHNIPEEAMNRMRKRWISPVKFGELIKGQKVMRGKKG